MCSSLIQFEIFYKLFSILRYNKSKLLAFLAKYLTSLISFNLVFEHTKIFNDLFDKARKYNELDKRSSPIQYYVPNMYEK